MTENWLPVSGFEGSYEVSDQGRVRSLDRVTVDSQGRSRRFPGKTLKPHVGDPPYPAVNLMDRGRRRLWRVHVLVLAAFVGPRPDGMLIRHLNGIRTDCRLENLAYGTPSENNLDKVAHGTDHNSRKTHCKRNHEFTPENTYHPPRAPHQRQCRACWPFIAHGKAAS